MEENAAMACGSGGKSASLSSPIAYEPCLGLFFELVVGLGSPMVVSSMVRRFLVTY